MCLEQELKGSSQALGGRPVPGLGAPSVPRYSSPASETPGPWHLLPAVPIHFVLESLNNQHPQKSP